MLGQSLWAPQEFIYCTHDHHEARLLESLRRPRGPNHHNYAPGSLCNVEELCLKKCKSKLLDDEVGKYPQAANNQVRNKNQHNTAPNQWILNSFKHLILLVFFVLDASLIVPHSLNHQALLILGKALG